jgi:hypothetical protein
MNYFKNITFRHVHSEKKRSIFSAALVLEKGNRVVRCASKELDGFTKGNGKFIMTSNVSA